jgi:hypothetical protein
MTFSSSQAIAASRDLALVVAKRALIWMYILGILSFLGIVSRPAHAATANTGSHLRRYALIASSNNGGTSRGTLRFANSDAKAMSDVLMQLGGLDQRDLVMLPNASRKTIETAFDKLRSRLLEPQAPGTRKELFVYYSGHSDEDGLLLGSERISYRELRQWIQELGADVRIAVLDSCASGALIRLKGGAMRAPFLSDVSSEARGHAYLTASSADESAQESDRVGAAFFTHYLVSGLRGAADTSRDGKVTLGEAYQFAYDETLRRTEKSRAGAQHPAYDIQLAGTGDLVMTDLRTTDATLVLSESLAGRVYVRDAAGRLLVELRKEPVYPVELGLGPGTYRVLLDADGKPFETSVTLEKGKRAELAQNDFHSTAAFASTLRGDDKHANADALRDVTFDLVAAPGVRLSGHPNEKVRHRFVLGLLGHSDELDGIQISLGGNIVEGRMHGAQFSLGMNLARGYGQGAQFSSGVNMALNGFTGIQVGATLNLSRGTFTGAQLGTANWSHGDFRGLQGSVVNYNNGTFHGLQAAVVNVNRYTLHGMQAGVVNLAGGTEGIAVAVVNIGGNVSGTQIGVVNIADKVKGAQIGVVNVADSVQGASIGLIPFVRDGYHTVSAWTGDLSRTNLSLKLGARHFYTLLGGGITNDADSRTTYSTHLGLGFHITSQQSPLFVDVDIFATQMGNSSDFGERDSVIGTFRAVVGYQIARHLALTLGPTYNVQTSWNKSDYKIGSGILEHTKINGDTTVRMFPGLAFGLQI